MPPSPISDYALIGNLRCAALVSRGGSIDWFCPPKFDAPACFAALLGEARHGCGKIAPVATAHDVQRCYLKETLVLEPASGPPPVWSASLTSHWSLAR